MRSPNKLTDAESLTLRGLLDLGAVPGSLRRTSDFIDHVSGAHGVDPGLGTSAEFGRCIHTLGNGWETSLALVHAVGNFGSPGIPAADPRFTEVGLTRLGLHVAKAEIGLSQPLPIGFIIGNQHCGGSFPPFDARRVVRALALLAGRSKPKTAIVKDVLGPPRYPSGCVVTGPIQQLLEGQQVDLTLSSRFSLVGKDRIEITSVPQQDLVVPWEHWLPPDLEVADLTEPRSVRFLVRIEGNRQQLEVIDYLKSSTNFRIRRSAALGGAWVDQAQEWLDRFDEDGRALTALSDLLNSAESAERRPSTPPGGYFPVGP